MTKKRILFLMSDTGGGHRAAANAIAEAINDCYPNHYQIWIEDIWQNYTPWPIYKIPATYPWLTTTKIPFWQLMWHFSQATHIHNLFLPGLYPWLGKPLIDYLQQIQPDLIISVHPLMNHLGIHIRNKAGLQHIPFVTVITDLVSIHPVWVCPEVTLCLVPTLEARHLALKFGISPHKVIVTGQPIGLKFLHLKEDKITIRQRLDLALERPTILVMGGGDGVGGVFEIAQAIASNVPSSQLLVVTGRNHQLAQAMQATPWQIPIHIYGFVDYMPELMKAADILVTKAGPGTLSEAFSSELPLILSGYIPGQEKGNITYVQKHRAGIYLKEPTQIAHLIQAWITTNGGLLAEMKKNAAALAKPQAALIIAQKVCNLI